MAGHGKRKHARFAASSSERWLNCPGSISLSETVPPSFDTEAAREGTKAHECLEFIIQRLKNPMLEAQMLQRGLWNPDMIKHGLKSAQTIMDLRPSPSAKLLMERKVKYDESEGMYGTLDYAWVEDWGQLTVIDYKYGRGMVLPMNSKGEKNPQLLYYASALLNELGEDFENITLAIIQPRVTEGATIVDVSLEEIKDYRARVSKAIKLAKSRSPPFKAGEHCRYCPAAPVCKELSQHTMSDANIVFDFEQSEVLALPEVRGLDSMTLGRMLRAASMLEIWIRAVREYAYVNAQRGEMIEGFKLAPKRAIRHWNDGAEKEMEKAFGKIAYSVKKVFLSPAELEKLKGSVGKEFTAKYASAISSGYTLVPADDSRPGIELGSVFDFD